MNALLPRAPRDVERASKCSPAFTSSQAMLGFVVQGEALELLQMASRLMHSTVKLEVILT